eukprot:GHVU01219728.1.p10 GENE.GHVU01219728.1~~GHVU01219728.1.p10  ORF type:complete len:211 (+),score=16.77 GHVU01219728.1:4633-5265(+)
MTEHNLANCLTRLNHEIKQVAQWIDSPNTNLRRESNNLYRIADCIMSMKYIFVEGRTDEEYHANIEELIRRTRRMNTNTRSRENPSRIAVNHPNYDGRGQSSAPPVGDFIPSTSRRNYRAEFPAAVRTLRTRVDAPTSGVSSEMGEEGEEEDETLQQMRDQMKTLIDQMNQVQIALGQQQSSTHSQPPQTNQSASAVEPSVPTNEEMPSN